MNNKPLIKFDFVAVLTAAHSIASLSLVSCFQPIVDTANKPVFDACWATYSNFKTFSVGAYPRVVGIHA